MSTTPKTDSVEFEETVEKLQRQGIPSKFKRGPTDKRILPDELRKVSMRNEIMRDALTEALKRSKT